jgi:hypothetical protein
VEDGLVSAAWNPKTGRNDLDVKVAGDKLEVLVRHSVTSALLDAENIAPTVRQPDSVFEAADDEGEWLYFRRSDTLPHIRPEHRMIVPPLLFYVRVRPTGARAFVWDYEDADPQVPTLPADRTFERIRRRLR